MLSTNQDFQTTSSKVVLIGTGTKQDLAWKPVADPVEFHRRRPGGARLIGVRFI